MATGWPEQVPGLVMMAMGGAGQPTSDLDLRFPMMLDNAGAVWSNLQIDKKISLQQNHVIKFE